MHMYRLGKTMKEYSSPNKNYTKVDCDYNFLSTNKEYLLLQN